MRCRHCSAEIPASSSYCNLCGAGQQAERPANPLERAASDGPAAEETLWKGRSSLKAAAHLWLAWILWCVALLMIDQRLGEARQAWGQRILLIAGLVPGLWILARSVGHKLSLRYRLSNHRLFIERGLLSRQHDELELIRVDDVSVRQSFFQRLLGVGTLTVLSTDASNPEVVIRGIERPLELKELVRAQVRALRARTTFLETL